MIPRRHQAGIYIDDDELALIARITGIKSPRKAMRAYFERCLRRDIAQQRIDDGDEARNQRKHIAGLQEYLTARQARDR